MASGTRRAARLFESQDREEEQTSEPRANPTGNAGPSESTTLEPPRENDGDDPSETRSSEEEEDELEYASLPQEELENRIRKAEAQVRRRRQERQLLALRREIRGEPAESVQLASELGALPERPKKRRKLSNDETSRSRRRLRPPEPVYYYGKNVKELEDFLTFWLIYIQSDEGESEAERVNIAASYLRGTPMKMWGKRLESQAPRITLWEDFKQWLRDSLKAPNQRILESTLALKELKQRQGQTAQELYVYMTELESNIPTMSEDQRRAWQLVNALHPEMRSRVVRDLQSIDTVEAVLACAGRNESTVVDKTSKHEARRSDSVESRARRHPSARRRFNRDKPDGSRRPNQPQEGGAPDATRGRDAATTPEGACFNCGEKGHRAKHCRNPKKEST
jgi:hypothetical protein